MGEYDLDSSNPYRQDIAVERIFVHEGFDEDLFYKDIAILLLAENVTWTPVCLPLRVSVRNACVCPC